MPARHRPMCILIAVLVVSAAALVHAPSFLGAQAGDRSTTISDRQRKDATTGRGGDGLPGPVADMRDAILEAVRSGSIDDQLN